MKIDFDKLDGIIWDMDGVLVDVSKSYREAIRYTASYILQKEISMKDVDLIKKNIGLNNDWDATYVLIQNVKNVKLDIAESIQYLRLQQKSDEYKFIKDVFQSVYLGKNLFRSTYQRDPIMRQVRGLIETSEELYISKANLVSIKSKYNKMAIATGRPNAEAVYTLKKSDVFGLFDVVIGLEDTKKAKPYPDSILKVMSSLNFENTVYIGDSPGDVEAATRAGIPSIYIGEDNLGDLKVNDISKLLSVLL